MKRKVGQDIIIRKKTTTQQSVGYFTVQRPMSRPEPVTRSTIQRQRSEPEKIVNRPNAREPEPATAVKQKAPEARDLSDKQTPPPVRDREFVRDRFQQSLPPSRGGLMWMFVGIALIILLVTIFSIISRARISVTLKEGRYSVDVPVILYEEPTDTQVGYKTATVIDTQSTIVPTANRDTSGSYAKGNIKLFSTSAKAISLPAKTILIGSAGKNFILDQKISLPAGSATKPSSADATITAAEAGEAYNIGREDFTVDKNPSVIAHSIDDIAGGSSSGNYTLTPAELTSAEEQLKTQIKLRDPSVYLSKQIPSNFVLLNTLIQTSDITFTSKSASTGVEVTAERTITGNMIDKKVLQQFLKYAAIPGGEQLYMIPSDISMIQIALENQAVTATPNPAVENKTLSVHVSGSFAARANFDQAEILPKIVHQRKKDAKKILENTPGVIESSITMWPPWVGKIPNRSSAITILTSFGVSA